MRSFDRAVCAHAGFLLANLARSRLLGLTRGRLAAGPVQGPVRRYFQQLAWLHMDTAGSGANVLHVEVLEELDQQLVGAAQSHPIGLVILPDKPAGFIAGADVKAFALIEHWHRHAGDADAMYRGEADEVPRLIRSETTSAAASASALDAASRVMAAAASFLFNFLLASPRSVLGNTLSGAAG